MRGKEQKLVLAVASGGGHWQQLLRLRPAFEEEHTIYVTTDAAYATDVPGSELFVVTDANQDVPSSRRKHAKPRSSSRTLGWDRF